MRIFTISDIHGDYDVNLKKVGSISDMDYQDDVLVVCGDLSHRLSLFDSILKMLKEKFNRVFFVPGNHDLWLDRNDFDDSLKKFEHLLQRIAEYGIETGPHRLGNTVLIPILSWYDYSFAVPQPQHKMVWADLARCRWKSDMEHITNHFLGLNHPLPVSDNDTVITYSHFVPRMDILPPRLVNYIPHIIPFLGSHRIDRQIREFRSQLHIFGHLHYNLNTHKDGVLYLNNALGYPHEHKGFDTLLYEISVPPRPL